MSMYTGTFDNKKWYQVFKDGALFSHTRSYNYVTHSPDGFSWGYGGSGPSQLAFGLLLDVTNDAKYCMQAYQNFKWEVIAELPQDSWSLTTGNIMNWVMNHENDYGLPKTIERN